MTEAAPHRSIQYVQSSMDWILTHMEFVSNNNQPKGVVVGPQTALIILLQLYYSHLNRSQIIWD